MVVRLKRHFYSKHIKHRFSNKEISNILIAWLVLSFAFAYVIDNVFNGAFILIFIASAIAIACGFIMHELMHKFTAQDYRYNAEFKIWPLGLLLALMTSLFGFIFAAPGATYFEPDPREPYLDPKGFIKRYGRISLAGPLINIVFGFVFTTLFYVLFVAYPHIGLNIFVVLGLLIGGVGGYINFYLAAFNMLPINPLDGYKVFKWNKPVWAAVFIFSAAMSALILVGYIPLLSVL